MDVAGVFQLPDSSPLVPFSVGLENGKRIPVTHPKNVTIFPDRDGTSILRPRGIAAVHGGDAREDVF